MCILLSMLTIEMLFVVDRNIRNECADIIDHSDLAASRTIENLPQTFKNGVMRCTFQTYLCGYIT
jgi:hypothetical protein